MGPPLSVRYNREIVITVKIYVVKKPDGTKMSAIFVRYSRDFIITVIVITEFDCTSFVDHLRPLTVTYYFEWLLRRKNESKAET